MLCVYIYIGISQVFPWLTSLTIKLVKIPATQESWGAGLEPRPEGKKKSCDLLGLFYIIIPCLLRWAMGLAIPGI